MAMEPKAAKNGTVASSVMAVLTAKSPGATMAALADLRRAVKPASRWRRNCIVFTAGASHGREQAPAPGY
ncbi:hypothetical protein GCM10022207_89790 [Streptomyces lannensis]|uniref:Uncharacterized protein n=1 Tax=Streptomyces lannensis TaxID=766498 RepID=A0ABP7LQ53_9ACTN